MCSERYTKKYTANHEIRQHMHLHWIMVIQAEEWICTLGLLNIFVQKFSAMELHIFTGHLTVCCNPVIALKFFLKMTQKKPMSVGSYAFVFFMLYMLSKTNNLASFVEETSGKL